MQNKNTNFKIVGNKRSKFDLIIERLDQIDKRLGNLETRMDNLETRMDNLIIKNNLKE